MAPRSSILLACAAAFLLVAAPAYSAPGDLDPGFGTGGKLTTSFGTFGANIEWANAVALQPDGKIVVAGYHDGTFALARYNANGTLDTTFDGDGRVTTSFGAGTDADVWAIVVQPDGKIVAAGPSSSFGANSEFALARYNADGTLDTTFDGDGKLTTRVGAEFDQAAALALQSDGKLVAAGSSAGDFALVRYNAEGTLDSTFDGDGKVTTAVGTGADAAYGVKVQADGKIVAAGGSSNGTNMDVALVRYASDGTLDTTFDGDGKVTTPIGSDDDEAYALALQADGRIVAAGYSGAFRDFALVRYDSDGALDATFDGDGKVTTSFTAGDDDAWALAVQADGKLVAGGTSADNFALARYNADGTLDTTFDGDGKVTTGFSVGSMDLSYGVAVQSDDKILLVGSTVVGHTTWGLARYLSDGALDTTFDGDGKLTTTFGPLSDMEEAKAVAVQLDGKLVAVGDTAIPEKIIFALARYNADGSLDPTFDGDGRVTTSVGAGNESRARAVAIQPDGKIVAAGYASNGSNFDLALARFNADGTPDTTFDGDGKLTTAVQSGDDRAFALALHDGKIVVAGWSAHSSGQIYLAVARYNPDGSPDTSFGGSPGPGWVTVGIGPGHAVANAVKVQVDGKIVAAGSSSNGANKDVHVVRLLTDGWLDASWSTPIGSFDDEAYALELQPDGKIVVAGSSSNGTNRDFALVRYNADTTLDTTFDWDGKVTTDISAHDEARSLALQPDGMLVAAGCAGCGTVSGNFALARYEAGGGPDAGFGAGGKATTNFASAIDVAYGIALQSDGKIAVAGSASQGHTRWALARYAGDGTPPVNPGLTSTSHTVGTWSSDPTVDVAFAGASDEWSGVDGFSYEWTTEETTLPDENVDEDVSANTSPELDDGDSHWFHLRARDNAGNWSDAVDLGPFWIDTVAPTRPSLGAALERRYQTRKSFVVSWPGASDGGSGVESHEVQVKTARWSGGFGSYATWKSAATGTSATFAGRPGRTYCFRARARDGADNPSAWSRTRCTAVPLNDRALTARGAWSRATGAGYYLGTRSLSWVPGAALVKTSLKAKRLAVVVTRSPACGRIRVYWKDRLLKEISLTAAATRKKQVVGVASFDTLRSGKVKIVAASSTGAACVEGLGVSAA